MIQCKICNQNFDNDKSFHIHLKKHGLYQAEYYCKYYPRYSLYNKQKIPFKNKKQYFETEFINFQEMISWEQEQQPETVRKKYIEIIKKRIDEKKYSFMPFHNELKTLDLPSIDMIKKHFGSYTAFGKEMNLELIFNKPLFSKFYENKIPDMEILIDTREQQPLEFRNSREEKLYIGDYMFAKNYQNTFIDRKSENDFLGTLASGFERFEREVEKAVGLNGYLFVVIESSIEDIKENHKRFRRQTNLEYVFHNMRFLTHKYPRRIQFLFTHNRNISIEIIPKLLFYGKDLWNVDIQYYLDKNLSIL